MKFIVVFTFLLFVLFQKPDIQLPVNSQNRNILDPIELTEIGEFGLMRKARPNIPAHYHTGIDIKRPVKNYVNEPIYSIAEGIVISMRNDGPYAQVIIEHRTNTVQFWTLYEHISGIRVKVNDEVNPKIPIARFMNQKELDKYGWQFDHFHFEVLKIKPLPIKPNNKNPQRLYNSFSLICYSKSYLEKFYYDPIKFLNKYLD